MFSTVGIMHRAEKITSLFLPLQNIFSAPKQKGDWCESAKFKSFFSAWKCCFSKPFPESVDFFCPPEKEKSECWNSSPWRPVTTQSYLTLTTPLRTNPRMWTRHKTTAISVQIIFLKMKPGMVVLVLIRSFTLLNKALFCNFKQNYWLKVLATFEGNRNHYTNG